jgi:Tol biopolymer transport system component
MAKTRIRIFILLTAFGMAIACNLPAPSGPAQTATVLTPTIPLTPTATPIPGPTGQIAYGSETNGVSQIVLMELETGTETSLTGSFTGGYYRPVFSPDGNRLALREDISMDGGGIAVMDVGLQAGRPAGAQPVELFHGFADSPTWSPDGTRVGYITTAASGTWQAFTVAAGGSAPAALPGIPAHATDLAWSPDGNWIAFANYENSAEQVKDIYLIHPDGSGLVNLTNTAGFDEEGPAWSPDSRQIAFAKRGRTGPVGGSDIFRMNADGSGMIQVTTDPADEFDAAWSPDGTQIAFTSTRNEVNDANYEIYKINADGTGELRLTYNRATDRWPTWRAAPADTVRPTCGTSAAFVADVTIPAGTQFPGPQPFTKVWRVQNNGTCAWAPAGFALRFSEGDPMGGALQVPLSGAIQPGTTVDLNLALTAPAAAGAHSGRWIIVDGAGQPLPQPDGRPLVLTVEITVLSPDAVPLTSALYFLSMRSGSTQLWRLETDGRTATQITDEPSLVTAYDVSPADGALAYVSNHQLLLADRGGSGRRVIANFGAANGGSPVWSADGTRLAYAFNGIHVYEPDTGNDRLLIANRTGDSPGSIAVYFPEAWSPDGTKILALIGYYEGAELGILSATDGTVLARGALTGMNAWRIDSRAVYQASASYAQMTGTDPGLQLLSETGATSALLADAFVWWPHQRSDGTLTYFVSRPAGMDVGAYLIRMVSAAADGSGETALRDAPLALDSRDSFTAVWTADGSAVAAAIYRSGSGSTEVLLIPADNNPPIFLMQDGVLFHWEM